MKIIKNKDIFNIFKRTLSVIDYKMVDHSERVMYILYKMLTTHGGYSQKEIRDICLAGFLHDIGAYKVEQLDSLANAKEILSFEVKNSHRHSVYGYLLLQNFGSLKELSDVAFYHHIPYHILIKSDCIHQEAASLVCTADRFDVLSIVNDWKINFNVFDNYRDNIFSGKSIDMLKAAYGNMNLHNGQIDEEYLDGFNQFLSTIEFDDEQVSEMLQLLVTMIDFQSPSTVTHTILTVGFSLAIARQFDLSDDFIEIIYYGSLLHDLGKMSTPVSILEKQGKLTSYEYEIMKDHVVATRTLLTGVVDDIIVEIASRHHEHMDGRGYPLGLKREDLSLPERIVGVADVLGALAGKRSYKEPYPDDRIKELLESMTINGHICPEVKGVVIANYDKIKLEADEMAQISVDNYVTMSRDYPILVDKFLELMKSK